MSYLFNSLLTSWPVMLCGINSSGVGTCVVTKGSDLHFWQKFTFCHMQGLDHRFGHCKYALSETDSILRLFAAMLI